MILPFMVHPGTLLLRWAGSCRQCRPAPWTSWSQRPRLRWSRRWPRSSCLCTCRSSLTPLAVRLSLCWGKPESIYLALQEEFIVFADLPVSGLFVWGPCCLSTTQSCLYSLLYSSESSTLHVWPLGDPKSDWAWGSKGRVYIDLPWYEVHFKLQVQYIRSTFEPLTQIHNHKRIYPVNPIRYVWN